MTKAWRYDQWMAQGLDYVKIFSEIRMRSVTSGVGFQRERLKSFFLQISFTRYRAEESEHLYMDFLTFNLSDDTQRHHLVRPQKAFHQRCVPAVHATSISSGKQTKAGIVEVSGLLQKRPGG